MSKAVMYFAEGYEEVEALTVVDILRRANVEVILAGVYEKTVVSAHQISLNMDTTIEDVDHTSVDMIILPGGANGVENMFRSQHVLEHIKKFDEEKKLIAAICAAPSILGRLGLLKERKATCYPGFEKYLEGCTVVPEKVVVSDHIITAQAVGAAMEFGLTLLERLEGQEIKEKIKKAMYV